MINIIAFVLGAIIFIGIAITCLPYAIGAALIGVAIWLTFSYWKISIPVWIGLFVLGYYVHKEEKKKVQKWKDEVSEPRKIWEIDNVIHSKVKNCIKDINTNNDYIFKLGIDKGIPYGRAEAFLNFFKKSIDGTEIYYFSAICSKDNIELREYGTLIARDGIYISKQLESKNSDGVYKAENIYIPFAGITEIEEKKNNIEISLIKKDSDVKEVVKLESSKTTLNISSINDIASTIKDTGISKTLYHENIIGDDSDIIADNKVCTNNEDNLDKVFKVDQHIASASQLADIAGIVGSNVKFNETYNETKQFMNGERGHGYAGEYANNTLDRLAQKDVFNAGQQLDEHGRQVKHGADRIVNGESIQTKYYKTAEESIGAAFQHRQAIYVNPDGTMMPIEVPRDQYEQAVSAMQKRIDNGQVPGAAHGTPAQNYVKKGWFTYSQACNVCKAGTMESLSIDVMSGIVSSSFAGSISGALVFATCLWNGKDLKEAAKISLGATFKTMGKSVLLYTLTMQLSRDQFANFFVKKFTKDGIHAGFEGIANPVAKLSNSMAKQISQSTLAKTSVGEFLGLRAVTGRAIISGTVIGIVVFGPDLVRAMRGRISKMQLLKNSAVGASSLAGAAVGQALIPIPVVGAMVGAVASGFVAKKTLDGFIEDDAIAMFQIFKEEFIDNTMCVGLSDQEFDAVSCETVYSKESRIILQDMYQSGDAREFAKEFVEAAVCEVLKKRKRITVEMIDSAYALYSEEVLSANAA